MSKVVFAGPSLFGVEPSLLEGYVRRPPARCGDLLRALHDGAAAIGLIDGVFGTVPSVWHKEILAALNGGVPVIGAASIGALRAAECGAFGMSGIGEIYSDYAEGRRIADADVAVLHAPVELGFQPLTVALVDAEAAVGKTLQAGLITPGLATALQASARRLHFRDRTWEAIFAGLSPGHRLPSSTEDFLRDPARSLKAADAKLLLAALRDAAPPTAADQPSGREMFNRTHLFMRLEDRCLRR